MAQQHRQQGDDYRRGREDELYRAHDDNSWRASDEQRRGRGDDRDERYRDSGDRDREWMGRESAFSGGERSRWRDDRPGQGDRGGYADGQYGWSRNRPSESGEWRGGYASDRDYGRGSRLSGSFGMGGSSLDDGGDWSNSGWAGRQHGSEYSRRYGRDDDGSWQRRGHSPWDTQSGYGPDYWRGGDQTRAARQEGAYRGGGAGVREDFGGGYGAPGVGRQFDERSGGMGRQSFAGRGPKDYTRSDERIREEISDRLTEDPRVDASEISVQVKDGEVTLSGTVSSRDEKRRAEDLAEDISGVKDVTNQLRTSRQGQSDRTGQSAGRTGSQAAGTQSGQRTGKGGSTAANQAS